MSSILKRKYDEEIPDSAKYVTPQASLPARRTQVKLLPDGKTSFTQNEIIRIMIPPQGYFDPEFSYLSFNVELTAPSTYKLKALEVWGRDSNAFVYDVGIDSIIAVGRPLQTYKYKGAADLTTDVPLPVPFVRHAQDFSKDSNAVLKFGSDLLVEWVPCGQVYPVLPYSAHGFFTRVVLRTANNTPIEDIQEYDYLSAHLGSLLQSQGYTDTMGALLEGWGDVETRAKMGLACVKGLQYIAPNFYHPYSFDYGFFVDTVARTDETLNPVVGSSDPSKLTVVNKNIVYSDWSTISSGTALGLSPEGVTSKVLREQVNGMKFTCNLNLGLFQQSQNLPLLFSGGLILELYTAPFDRCITFTSIYSSADPVDFPNLLGKVDGDGHLIDITAMNLRLPTGLTNAIGLENEAPAGKTAGTFFDVETCPYAQDNITSATAASSGDTTKKRFLQPGLGPVQAVTPFMQTLKKSGTDKTFGVNTHLGNTSENITKLESRMAKFTEGWSYSLTNVELRADMVQFSQSYDESIAEIVDSDEGLPITFQTFSTQKVSYDGKRATLTVNERARSIQFALAVFKDVNLERKSHTILFDNDTRFILSYDEKAFTISSIADYDPSKPNVAPAALTPIRASILLQGATPAESAIGYKFMDFSHFQRFVTVANPWVAVARVLPNEIQQQALFPNLSDYQFRVGTRFIPASPVDCSAGAVQAYIELMKAIGMYGSFSGTGQRALMPGNRITPDLYAKRICTAASRTLAGAYYNLSTGSQTTTEKAVRNVQLGQLQCKDYVGQRYRIPQRFILGMNFSDIPDHASGVDTATQALSIELALNGDKDEADATSYNCYMFLNVRRDLFVRCGGQIEILY